MTKKIPPFYENFDNTHCAQCTLRGILEYFEPEEVWSWEEWDEFTGKEEGKWTWPERGQINMANRGYGVKSISKEDLNLYLQKGVYLALVEMFGEKTAQVQRDMSPDFNIIEEDIKRYLSHPDICYEQRLPTIKDIRALLKDGYLICSALNSEILNNRDGYSSHFVLVYDIDDEFVYMRDSSVPETPERKEKISHFINASINPTEEQWSINAFKLEKKHG